MRCCIVCIVPRSNAGYREVPAVEEIVIDEIAIGDTALVLGDPQSISAHRIRDAIRAPAGPLNRRRVSEQIARDGITATRMRP